jgi:hypothetical protein
LKAEFQYTENLDPVGAAMSGLPIEPDGKWWFWDEMWVNAYGPYETEEEAAQEALLYGRML